MLSLAVREYSGTGLPLPAFHSQVRPLERKRSHLQARLGLEETPEPWQRGKSGFPCPMVVWRGSRQEENQTRNFKQPASHCPFQMLHPICGVGGEEGPGPLLSPPTSGSQEDTRSSPPHEEDQLYPNCS